MRDYINETVKNAEKLNNVYVEIIGKIPPVLRRFGVGSMLYDKVQWLVYTDLSPSRDSTKASIYQEEMRVWKRE